MTSSLLCHRTTLIERLEDRRCLTEICLSIHGESALAMIDTGLPGDADLDGDVDFDDFLTLSGNFQAQNALWADGDFNVDMRVDFDDFLFLSRNFGRVQAYGELELRDEMGQPISSAGRVFVDEQGAASVVMSLETRKVDTKETFYVDAALSSGGDGRTWATAFPDIDVAIAEIKARSIRAANINVAAGHYIWGDLGNPGFDMNIAGAGMGKTVVQQHGTNKYAAQIRGRDVYIEGMTFAGGVTVLDIRDSANVTIVRAEITGATKGGGLHVENAASTVVYASQAHRNDGNGFSYANPDGTPMEVLEAFVDGSDNGLNDRWNSYGSTTTHSVEMTRVGSTFLRNPTNLSDLTSRETWNVDVTAGYASAHDQSNQFLNLNVSNDAVTWIIGGDFSRGENVPSVVNAQPGAQIRYVNSFNTLDAATHIVTGDAVIDDTPLYPVNSPCPRSGSVEAVQLESIRDRTIHSAGFDAFHATVLRPSVSPALTNATSADLTITKQLPNADLTAVVLKPRPIAGVYQIPVPDDDENVHSFLASHLRRAESEGVGTIRFPYAHVFKIVPPTSTTPHLNLKRLRDVVIDFNESTLRLTQFSTGVRLTESSRVVLKNGTIQGHGVLASVARVVADDSPAGIRFDLLPEYRSRLDATDVQPNIVTVGSAEPGPENHFRVKVQAFKELFVNRGRRTNRFEYRDGSFIATAPLDVSDRHFGASEEFVWLLHQNNIGHGLLLVNEDGVEDVTLENLSFVNIPGMAIVGEVIRGLHIQGVQLKTNPVDDLAIFASSSDGIHINANGGDIVIENSSFGPNADDKINIKGNYWRVMALDRTNKTMTLEPADRDTSVSRWGWKSDRLVFLNDDFSVRADSRLSSDSVRENGKRHLVTLTQVPENVDVGDLIGNVDRDGGRVVIRNNLFQDTRAQGVLVQSSHVAVINNHFNGIAGPAIKLNTALELWFEGISVSNVLLARNSFQRSSRSIEKVNQLLQVYQVDGLGRQVSIIDAVQIEANCILPDDPLATMTLRQALCVRHWT